MLVGVLVGVLVIVLVGVLEGVLVGVSVGVFVGVFVADIQDPYFSDDAYARGCAFPSGFCQIRPESEFTLPPSINKSVINESLF